MFDNKLCFSIIIKAIKEDSLDCMYPVEKMLSGLTILQKEFEFCCKYCAPCRKYPTNSNDPVNLDKTFSASELCLVFANLYQVADDPDAD